MKKTQASFQFTLILKNVNENTPQLEDSLFETGCDDALINFRNGAVFLDFDRDAESFQKAIYTAIQQVESAPISPQVASVAPENLVTMTEAAKRLNKSRQVLSLWIKEARRKSEEKPFPHPSLRLADKSPLWKWTEIIEWLYFHNLLEEKNLQEQANFIEDINGALELRDKKIKKEREEILGYLIHNKTEDYHH